MIPTIVGMAVVARFPTRGRGSLPSQEGFPGPKPQYYGCRDPQGFRSRDNLRFRNRTSRNPHPSGARSAL